MPRWIGRVLGLLAVLFLITAASLIGTDGAPSVPADTARITDYRADFTVDTQGRLQAVERLTVNLPQDKHGIFRFFDETRSDDQRVRLVPHDVTVTRDGIPEAFQVEHVRHGRFLNLRIGRPHVLLPPGDHLYTIRYTIPGVLQPGSGDGSSRFYWQLVPGGWRTDIDKSDLTVHLPGTTSDRVDCAVGSGRTSGCTADGAGTSTLHVTTGHLDRNTPVTVRTAVDVPAPAQVTAPWSWRLDPLLGRSRVPVLVTLVLAVLAAVIGHALSRPLRERKPQFPLLYAPPDGIGPAQAAYLFTERFDRDAYVASLMHAGEQGAVQLQRDDQGWTISARDGADWSGLDQSTRVPLDTLGVGRAPFTASRESATAGQTLKSSMSSLRNSVQDWARSNGFLERAGLGVGAGFLVVVAGLLTVFLGLINPFDRAVVALVPGAFAVFGFEAVLPGAATRRTAKGRELWSRIGGFRRVLATPSAEARFDFSGRQELYTAYIPWAVALGCADAWAAKYRTEVGAEPPVPAYFLGGYYYGGGSMVTDLTADFSATLNSAVSAYTSSQSSSSGGGFGGGGGGGGGGGSW